MAALALAPLLPGLLRRRGVRLAVFALTVLLAALLALGATLALLRHPPWAVKIEQSLDPRIWWLGLAIGVAGLVIAALTRVRRAPLGWLLFAGVLWGLYGLWGYPDAQRRPLGARRDGCRRAPSPVRRPPSACWPGRSRTC